MKKLAIAAIITTGVLGLSACSSEDQEVVVEMDQGNITKEEFYQELKSTAGESVLHSMVYSAILEDKYEIDEDLVDEQVETMKEQYGDSFDMVLMQNNFQSEEDFRDAMRLSLLEQKAMTDGIEVTDEEVQTRYERLPINIEASHILVEDEELANDLYEQLLDGADFAELAEEHSTDPGSAANGGELGVFGAGDMVPEFEDKAYSLGIDEIGEPVQSEHGWHIIKVTDIQDTEAELEPLEDIKEELRDEIAYSRVDETEMMAKIAELFDDANVDVNIEEFEDLFNFDDILNPEDDDADEADEADEANEDDQTE